MNKIKNKIKEFAFKLYCKIENYNNANRNINGELNFINSLTELNCVFDVGANVGDYSKMILNKFDDVEIHAFEPQKKCFNKLNKLNLIINNVGASDVEKNKSIYSFESGSGLASLYKRELKSGIFNKEENVKLIRLDNYIEKNNIKKIDLLKADVEGHELSVFKGLGKYLDKDFIKMIQFEYGGCNIDARILLRDLFKILEKSGYTLYRIMPKGLRKIKYTQNIENNYYCNYIAK